MVHGGHSLIFLQTSLSFVSHATAQHDPVLFRTDAVHGRPGGCAEEAPLRRRQVQPMLLLLGKDLRPAPQAGVSDHGAIGAGDEEKVCQNLAHMSVCREAIFSYLSNAG